MNNDQEACPKVEIERVQFFSGKCQGTMGENHSRHIIKHFTVIGAGTLLNAFISLLTTPVITRIVDPVEYGQLSIFTMYTSIAVMILCMGLDQALVRYYYENSGLDQKAALLFGCIRLPLLFSSVLSLVVLLLSYGGIITFEFDACIMAFLCVNTITQLIYRFSLLLVRLDYKSKWYSMLNVLQKAGFAAFALGLLAVVKGNDFFILAFATTVSFLVSTCISIVLLKDMWKACVRHKAECRISQKELLKYAYPYVFSMGITMIFQMIDKISLNIYRSYNEVGIYASAMNLVHIFAIVQTAFNALWAPMAVEHYTKDKEDRRFYQQGNQIITVVMFAIGVSLILCKDVFAVLLGEKYRQAAYILPCLIFNPIMYTISETTVNGLVFMKKSGMQVVVAAGACIVNVLGNRMLVPAMGCQGAAISTGISYIVFFALRTYLSNRYFYVDLD